MSRAASPINVSKHVSPPPPQPLLPIGDDDRPPPPSQSPTAPPPPPKYDQQSISNEQHQPPLPPSQLSEEQQSQQSPSFSSASSLSAAKESILSFIPYVTSATDRAPWLPPPSDSHCICTYDPALDISSLSSSSSSAAIGKKEKKKPIYKKNDMLTPQQIKTVDPRKAMLSAEELLDRRKRDKDKKRYKMKCVQELLELNYQYDRNSPGDPPPPPPTAVVITGIHNLTPFEHIRRQFATLGKIAEHDFKLSPFDGNALGICWIRFVDEFSRSPYEDERKKEMEVLERKKRAEALSGGSSLLQDGHSCANEAVKKMNGTRLIPASVSIPDTDGFVKVEMDSAKRTKYNTAVKLELEKRKPKRKPRPHPRTDQLRIQKDGQQQSKQHPSTSSLTSTPHHQTSKSPLTSHSQGQPSAASSSSLPAPIAVTGRKTSQQPSGSSPLLSSHRNSPLHKDKPTRQHSPSASSTHRPSSPHSARDHRPHRSNGDDRRGRSSRWSDDEHRGRSRTRSLTPPRGYRRRRSRSVSSTPPRRSRRKSYDDDSDYYYKNSGSRYSSPGRHRRGRRRSPPPRRRGSPDDDYYRLSSKSPDGRFGRRSRYSRGRSPTPLSPPPSRHYRRSRRSSFDSRYSSDDDSDWSRRSADSDSESYSSSEEDSRDKVFFHQTSKLDRRQPMRRQMSRSRSAVRNGDDRSPRRRRDADFGKMSRDDDRRRNRDDNDDRLESKSSSNLPFSSRPTDPPEKRRDAIRNLIVENGFPYISIEVDALRRSGGKRDSILSDLRNEFDRFGVSNIENDPTDVYVLFKNQDGAQRCHLVQNRKLFHGQPLTLTLHDALDTFKFLNVVTGRDDTTAMLGRREDEARGKEMSSRERVVSQACDMICKEVLQIFLKDYKNRIVAPRVWKSLDARKKSGDNKYKNDEPSTSSANDELQYQKIDKSMPDAASSSLPHQRPPLPAISVSSGGILKLPSFAKRNKEGQRTPLRSEYKDEEMKESPVQTQNKYNFDQKTLIDEEMKSNGTPVHDESADQLQPELDIATIKVFSPAPLVTSKPKKRKQRREIVYSSTEEDEPTKTEKQSSISEPSVKTEDVKKTTTKVSKPAPKKRKVAKDVQSSSVATTPTTEGPPIPLQLQSIKVEEDVASASSTGERSPDSLKRDTDIIMESPSKRPRRRLTDDSHPAPLDPFSIGVARDEEEMFYLKMALQRLNDGEPMRLPINGEDNDDDQSSVIGQRHITGSARTEGFYKVAASEKLAYLMNRNNRPVSSDATKTNGAVEGGSLVGTATANDAVKTDSRSARLNSRRLAQGFEQHKKQIASDTDVLKFNQLKTRKKQMKFSRSTIHWYGLYSMESIPAGDMVIEYVGELIQHQVVERREKQYERMGIGSSYLFRVDDDQVVDATRKGNLGRLINHCCTPNCTARIITINGQKKIVIYAKSNIEPGEEITYDYKFPFEDEKIVCLCGSSGCRGYLN